MKTLLPATAGVIFGLAAVVLFYAVGCVRCPDLDEIDPRVNAIQAGDYLRDGSSITGSDKSPHPHADAEMHMRVIWRHTVEISYVLEGELVVETYEVVDRENFQN